MADWNVQLQNIANLRTTVGQLDEQYYAGVQTLQKAQRQLINARRTNPREVAALEQNIKKLSAANDQVKERLGKKRAELLSTVAGIYEITTPQQLLTRVSDNIPMALLPVRLETRFQVNQAKPELWIRVYPDEIAIHSHEKTLTDDEVNAGKKYWTTLFEIIRTNPADADDQKKAAWQQLVSGFTAGRAAWIALQAKPLNWQPDLSGLANASDLNFPVFDLTKTQSWSRAARTKVMPDKFVCMLYDGDAKVIEVVGQTIPDDLQVGPDPDPAIMGNNFIMKADNLTFGPDFDWTSDFEKAVTVGMGFRIPLTAAQAKSGFDRLTVVGLRLSGDAAAGQQLLEELIDNHHYSPQGFGLLAQGSATNNTPTGGSSYSQTDPQNSESYTFEAGPPLFTETDDCDGRNLADGLGISYETLQHVALANLTDNREAVLMNRALYAGTLGYYADTMLNPVIGSNAQEYLGDFFTRFVTGRGPLPAIRVGQQPYGILLTSDFSSWQWNERELSYPMNFLQKLYQVLSDYELVWKNLLPQLVYAGKPGEDPNTLLLNVLGLNAGSVAFTQRTAYSTEDLYNRSAFEYGGRYYQNMQASYISKGKGLSWLQSMGYTLTDSLGNLKVPQILRLVYLNTTNLDPLNCIDNVPVSETAPIHNYDTVNNKNYLDWLAGASLNDLQSGNLGAGIPTPNQLLWLMLRKSLLQGLLSGSSAWFEANGVDVSPALGPVNFHNIRPGGTLTKWEVVKAPLGIAVQDHPQKNMAIADYLLGPGKSTAQAVVPQSIIAAISELAKKPTARLQRCLTEHLDTLSYRLDSWQTALFTLRLKSMRNTTVHASPAVNAVSRPAWNQQERKQGICLGAYGWVENVRPATRTVVSPRLIPQALQPADRSPVYHYGNNGGYVHTPSINHATAAAILRSGYLSHASLDNPDALSINISSERVRRARALLEGIRNGQGLDVLLGYQFERGLHDRASADNTLAKLNAYIYDFRNKFTIDQTLIQQQGQPGGAQTTIPANDVVNGRKLAEATGPFPYGATGSVETASDPEKIAIAAEKDRLNDSLDAVNDLLTAESVYQVALGNFDRAGAVINAVKDATPPPTLDCIDTPRGKKVSLTNRVTIQFDNDDPTGPLNSPWAGVNMTARAKMETGLNKWLADLLGNDPTTIGFQVSVTDEAGNLSNTRVMNLKALGIQPIDLFYMVGNDLNTGEAVLGYENKTGASELESRIAAAYKVSNGINDDALIAIQFLRPQGQTGLTPLGELLPLLRQVKLMITDSRYLNAQDFNAPSASGLANTANPRGYAVGNLSTRVGNQQAAYYNAMNSLRAITIHAEVTEEDGTISIYNDMGHAVDALDEKKLTFGDITCDISPANTNILLTTLMGIANLSLGQAFPQVTVAAGMPAKVKVLDQARAVVLKMKVQSRSAADLITQATAQADPVKQTETLITAGKALLGDNFVIIPLFEYNNEDDILKSKGDQANLLSFATNNLNMIFPADEWMQNAAYARPRLARWDAIRSLSEIGGKTLALDPVQLPYMVKDNWLAVQFPSVDPNDPTKPYAINQDTLSVVIHGSQAFLPGRFHSGILIDDWVEHIPTKEQITGIAFNYDQPNSFPPQAILLVVPPVLKGTWNWDELVNSINDTQLRAKLRAVEPDLLATVDKAETGVLLPALLSNFSQTDLDFSLDYRMNINIVRDQFPQMQVVSPSNH